MDFRDKCSSQTASVLNRHILLRINHYVAKIAVSGPGKWVRSLFKATQWFGRWHGEMLREYRLGPSIPHVSQEGGPRRSSLPENNPEYAPLSKLSRIEWRVRRGTANAGSQLGSQGSDHRFVGWVVGEVGEFSRILGMIVEL